MSCFRETTPDLTHGVRGFTTPAQAVRDRPLAQQLSCQRWQKES